MLGNLRYSLRSHSVISLISGIALLFSVSGVFAQQNEGRVLITSTDDESAPTFILRAYAVDQHGNPIELTAENILIEHGGEEVSDVQVIGEYEAGTFTVFVIDIPGGLEIPLQSFQETIEAYARPATMSEGHDFLAIFSVGESDADQLLSPTNFYNSIRNFFFSTPLERATGQTALADSMGNLLETIGSLSPKGDMATSVVLITDGTDAVSTIYDLEDLGAQAASLGIPIHTVWLQNDQLRQVTRDEGRDFMAQLASQTGGVAAHLGQTDELQAIWDRIAAFRNHDVIQYRPENFIGGQNEVVLSLRDFPSAKDSASITVPESSPIIEMILSEESREISLETLEDPVRLVFSTSVSWLDAVERLVSSAELYVNDVPVHQIDVDELERFTAEVNYFKYGPNDIRVKIVDELGQPATSPVIRLMIIEGDENLPEDMRPDGIMESPIFRIGLGCLALILVLAILAAILMILRKAGIRGRLRRSATRHTSAPGTGGSGQLPPSDVETTATEPDPGGELTDDGAAGADQVAGSGSPYLEVLASVTRMPPHIELSAVEHRIGRSPVQADIVLENDITVSRLHASIVLEGSDYRIYDEGSSSGTWVNGQQLPDYGHQLLDGDEIRLGDAWMRYRR
jgi:hypothetical protein